MKKVVLKLSFNDDKLKQKAMKTVSGLSGVDSVSMDMKDKKLTVTGDVDPVNLASKLRKLCLTEIVSVGPAKAEEKKEEPKKEEPKKEEKKLIDVFPMIPHHYYYNNPVPNYYARTVEEDPYGACVIS